VKKPRLRFTRMMFLRFVTTSSRRFCSVARIRGSPPVTAIASEFSRR